MPAPLEEPFVAHQFSRDRVAMASAVRGTIILSSLRGVRSHGFGEAYLKHLDPRFHPTVDSLTAATWLPLDFALAHYGACERLALDRTTIEQIGADSGRFVNQTVLTVVAKLSSEGGVTPWFALSNANKLVSRTWIGSSFAVWKLGPKEARVEWIQQPIASIPYFRAAFAAFTRAICGLFAETIYVREMPKRTTATEMSFRVSWV